MTIPISAIWKTRLAFGCAIAVLCVAGALSYRDLLSYGEVDQWVRHTYEVLQRLDKLSIATVSAESQARGFVSTGDESYLQKLHASEADAVQQEADIRTLTSDNPGQQRRISVVEGLTAQNSQFVAMVGDMRRAKGMEAADEVFQSGRGQQIMKDFRSVVGDMQDDEIILLRQRSTDAKKSSDRTKAILIFGTALGLLITAAAARSVERDSAIRRRAEQALYTEKERAQVTLNSIGDAVACTDLSGNLTFLNRVAESLTGWSWREAAEHPVAEVFHVLDASNRDPVAHLMEIALQSDRVATLSPDSVLIRRDGTEIPIEDSVAPIHDRDGRATGAVIVLRDVSESRAMALKIADSVTDLAKQNAQLNRVNAELAAIVRSSPIAIFATDPEGLVTMWSPAAERLSGFDDQQAIGLFLPIVPDDEVENFKNRVRRVLEGEPASNVEFMGRRKDGAMVELSLSMGPLTDESGVSRGVISLAVNVTEAVAERKKIERMQNDFVSTVSHELRTPLTSIGGSLALIAGGAVGVINERATRLVEIANNNSQRLIRLVDDILDIEKLQTGKMVLRFEEINLNDVVEQAISANLAYAAGLGVDIRRVGEISNVPIQADADRVNQVITNLLSNASKFSPAGGRVEISVAPTDFGVRVTVSDHGSGISDEFRARIFEPFAQADTSDGRKKSGSGLGLSIVRKIMERHGGKVSFESNSDVGTSFHLDFRSLPAKGSGPDVAEPALEQRPVLV